MPLRLSTTLENWLRTGSFGPLNVGDSASDVVALLGRTEVFGPKQGISFPGYWLYDEVEFGFGEDTKIKWIQSDTVRIESARAAPLFVDIDWQGIIDRMPLQLCLEWLDDHGLQHRHWLDDDGGKIVVENRTQMLLTESDVPRLVTIWSPASSNDQ